MKKKIIIISSITLIITFIVYISYFSDIREWRTQNIIYKNIFVKDKRIEFQVKSHGKFGYTSRIVKIESRFLIDKIDLIDTTTIDPTKWRRVDIFINEMGK